MRIQSLAKTQAYSNLRTLTNIQLQANSNLHTLIHCTHKPTFVQTHGYIYKHLHIHTPTHTHTNIQDV